MLLQHEGMSLPLKRITPMTDQNRGIMKFQSADSTPMVTISAVLILGSIAFLIIWALQSAYAIG
jgi:hypothetical protein